MGGFLSDPIGNIQKEVKKTIEHPGQALVDLGNAYLNYSTMAATGGLLEFEGGKIGKGPTTHAIDEGIGELNGRNYQRQLANEAGVRLQQEDAQRRQDLLNLQEQNRLADVAASSGARGIRQSAAMQGRGNGTFFSGSLGGGDEQDFLGL